MLTLRRAMPGRYTGCAGVPPTSVECTNVASDEAVSAARHLAARTLVQWGLLAVLDDCVLVADELAGNAAKAGRCCIPPQFVLRLSRCPGFVIIQAGDQYPAGPPRPRRHVRWQAESRRGLPIAQALSAQLAWYRDTDGWKWVWAAMADSPAVTAANHVQSRDGLVRAA